MARPEKKPARRPKRVLDSPFYVTSELMARYRKSRRSLRRMSVEEGYPMPINTGGRELGYLKTQVHDWEKKHMPELHAEPEMSEDDKRWHLMHLQYQLDKKKAELDPPPPPPKPRRPPQRARA